LADHEVNLKGSRAQTQEASFLFNENGWFVLR